MVSNTFQIPKILNQILVLFKERYPSHSDAIILNVALAKMAQMITAKRVHYSEFGKQGYPNYYAINFEPSGYGKDKMSDEMDNYIFKNCRLWIKNQAEDYKLQKTEEIRRCYEEQLANVSDKKQIETLVKKDSSCIRNITLEINKATPEGIFCDAKALIGVDFGSLMIKMGEFGLMLKNSKVEDQQCFQSIFELYDGKLSSKCIKTENREDELSNIPCNILLYSDPTLFASELKGMFDSLMQMGFGRRATIIYMPKTKLTIEEDVDKALEQSKNFARKADELGNSFFSTFLNVNSNSVFELLDETFKQVFHTYKISLNELVNNEENTLLARELKSRELKALKLSCLFAVLNHPANHVISPLDMEQAISVVNFLGSNFKEFIKLKPAYKDLYERVFDFFKEHLDEEFTITDLKRTHYNAFGCSRKMFDKNFDEIIKYVNDIASEKGFLLNVKESKPKGVKYSLSQIPTGDVSIGVKLLEDII